jgi:hypothetical protein
MATKDTKTIVYEWVRGVTARQEAKAFKISTTVNRQPTATPTVCVIRLSCLVIFDRPHSSRLTASHGSIMPNDGSGRSDGDHIMVDCNQTCGGYFARYPGTAGRHEHFDSQRPFCV